MMRYLIISLLFILQTSCSTVGTSPKTDRLDDLCHGMGQELRIHANIIGGDENNRAFFGGSPPDGIESILVCLSNGTNKKYGIKESSFKIEVQNPQGDVSIFDFSKDSILGDGSVTASAATTLGIGTAVLGFGPGFFFAAIAHDSSSSVSTDISINMKNKRFSSGVVKPMTYKSGLLYLTGVDKMKDHGFKIQRISCDLLDLDTKKYVTVTSSIQDEFVLFQ